MRQKRKTAKFSIGEKVRLNLWDKPIVTITKLYRTPEGFTYSFAEDTTAKALGIRVTTHESLFRKTRRKKRKRGKRKRKKR